MGRQIEPSIAETVASQSLAAPAPDEDISRATSVAEEEGRFVPGTLLGGRYRIIALLGRGGMGEVYRAMDLTLGQSVALKFLPESASKNQRLLERFHGEVRVARLVSHPNVCRVYDIGEIDGMPFISMEYVDGEDLASLLTRIGRLPAGKALETARKLCAGLAAAHDRGVIHRDLKPQNIMMNKRGEVVIMDFGLAAIADHLTGAEVRNGTPAYMSPEQLKGETVTPKSDIYALGLVLYEIFTGKRPYDAASLQQLMDMQHSVHISSMVSVAADVDPLVEKVIRRCLDPDPARRPAGAVAILTALPGGDPLAAALAAGETPSPEMVAAAGSAEGMARKYSIPCLLVALACLAAVAPMRQSRSALMNASLDRSPDVLAHQSRTLAAEFGSPGRPADSATWLGYRAPLIGYLRALPKPHLWQQWYAASAPILSYYRESPQLLVAGPTGEVDLNNPPANSPGMVEVTLDGHGKLLNFDAVPNGAAPALAQPVGAEAVFRAAALDLSRFREIDPGGPPDYPFDSRRAWKGPHPTLPRTELLVDVAWWKGRVTRAKVSYPWVVTPTTQPPPTLWSRARVYLIWGLEAFGAIFVILLARRNWKLNRADRRGAVWLAAARILFAAIGWVGRMHPIDDDRLISHFLAAAGDWLFSGFIMWVVYLALEPEVRARWPHSIGTWNRVLAGRFGDALVASDILLGAAAGGVMWVLFKLLSYSLGGSEPTMMDVSLFSILGTRQWIGGHTEAIGDALRLGIIVFLAVFGLRTILRNDWLAVLATALIFTMTEAEAVRSSEWMLMTAIYVLVYSSLIFLLLRRGLVTTITTIFFVNCVSRITLGGDWKAWYAPAGFATLLLLAAIAILAFWRSLGGRDLLGNAEAV